MKSVENFSGVYNINLFNIPPPNFYWDLTALNIVSLHRPLQMAMTHLLSSSPIFPIPIPSSLSLYPIHVLIPIDNA